MSRRSRWSYLALALFGGTSLANAQELRMPPAHLPASPVPVSTAAPAPRALPVATQPTQGAPEPIAWPASSLKSPETTGKVTTYAPTTPAGSAPAPGTVAPSTVVDMTPHNWPPKDGHDSHAHEGSHGEDHESAPQAFFVSADYLLWRARRGGGELAIPDATHNLTPNGNIESLDYETRSGVRVGIGTILPARGWEVSGTYTYYRSGNERVLGAPPGGTLYALQTRPGLVDNVLTAQGDVKLNYSVFDAQLSKRVPVDGSFLMTLSSGLRTASIDQQLRAFYTGGDANGTFVDSQTTFDGIGLFLGGEGRWKIGYGLSLYGRGRSSLVFGDVRNKLVETDAGGLVINNALFEKREQLVPVLDLGVGVTWAWRNVSVSLGYDAINWFGLINQPVLTDDFAEGNVGRRVSDLSLEGLTFSLGLLF